MREESEDQIEHAAFCAYGRIGYTWFSFISVVRTFQWNFGTHNTGTDGWMDTRGVSGDLFTFSFALGVLHPIAVNSLSEACAHMEQRTGAGVYRKDVSTST